MHSYNAVTYKNVYEGIDVKYYTAANGSLENDVIVKPGADATNVAMEIKGANTVNVTADGKLQMMTSQGMVEMLPPVSYLKDATGKLTEIKVTYTSKGTNKVGFSLPTYDKSQTLVIDPIVERWATLVSTNASNTISHNHGVCLDASGNIYVTGYIQGGATGNTSILITTGAYAATSGQGNVRQTFIGKYTEPATVGGAGTRVWQTYMATDQTSNNYPNAINLGPDGFLYICGTINGSATTTNMAKTYGTFTPAPTFTNTAAVTGAQAGYVAKIKADGTGAAVRSFNGLNAVSPAVSTIALTDIRVMPGSGSTFSLIVTGTYQGTNAGNDVPALVSPAGVAQTYNGTTPGTTSSYCFNLSSDLNTVTWSKNIGLGGAVINRTLISTLDFANNIYLAGNSNTDGLGYKAATQGNLVGTQDGWLMKLNSAGTVAYSRYVNSLAGDITSVISMELNSDGTSLIFGGLTNGLTAANITGTPYQPTNSLQDFFIQKVPVSGATPVWGTYLGGTGIENNMMGLNTDANNDVYILGYSPSTDFPVTAGRVQNYQAGATYQATFSKISANGQSLLYSTTLGGTNEEQDPAGERGILFANCRIYLAITTASNDFPFTQNAVTTAKLTPTGTFDPALVSMANPPDFNTYSITPASQSITCGSSAANITSTAVTYNVPRIVRNGAIGGTAPTNTSGTATEYPTGYGLATTTYQWQKSIDGGSTWTNISGANGLTITPGAVVQNTNYRLIANGDVCVVSTGPTASITVTGSPTASPSAACTSTSATFASNATGSGTLTYSWTYPATSTRGPGPTTAGFTLTNVNSNDAGTYTVTVTSSLGCVTTKTLSFNPTTCGVTVLPIELASFTANTSGCGVLLNWTTASELNNEFFVVERSTDGINYTELHRMQGAGTSMSQHSYNYMDNAVKPLTRYYYRLRQIDIDGTGTYSNIAIATPWCAANGAVIRAYPIPASSFVNVSGLVGINSLSLFDMNGKKVISILSSNSIETISLGNLAKGVYLLRVTDANGTTSNLKVVKD